MSHVGPHGYVRLSPRQKVQHREGDAPAERGGFMSRRRLMAVALFVVMAGMIGPAALAGDSHSDVITFTTQSNGTRLITLHTAPVFSASPINLTGSGTVATTVPATTQVTEVAAAGANWAVTAQVCGPHNEDTITETAALTAAADCANDGAQFAGYNTVSGAYQTNLTGDRITATSSVTNSGTGLLHATATTNSPSAMSSPVTVLNSNNGEVSTSSYTATYAATTNLSLANVTDNATWVGFWVTTLTP